jgi:hypothetical protein
MARRQSGPYVHVFFVDPSLLPVVFPLLLLYAEWDPSGMSHLSTSLRSESAKYRKAARNINLQALIRKWAPIGGLGLFFILFIWYRFF